MRNDDQTATGIDTSPQDRRGGLAHPVVGETLDERFLLRSILGSGATGMVYAAVDATVGQAVAIKLLHPDLRDTRTRERLRREVRASRPGHPNIVSVFDLFETGDHLFLSMELVEGRSLRSWLEKEGSLPVDRVIAIGRQMASALDHLHAKGLVHRDVKPGNILVPNTGAVKLCDMGLTRPLEEGVTVTETEMIVGTPNYMAPEQATGAELTGASDIYSLGLTLYQALTGEIPLKEPTAIATLSRRQKERPDPVRRRRPDCPRWLDRLIRRMLEPNPQERPSAAAVFKAFETRRLLPRPRRRTVITAAAVLIVIAAGILGARLLTRRPTAVVEVGATSISGRDERGRITWQRQFEMPVTSEVRGDPDGDGIEDIGLVIAESSPLSERSRPLSGPEVWIFRRDGTVLTHFVPEERLTWNFGYDSEITVTLQFLDSDHDGISEPFVIGRHLNFFPAVIFRCNRDFSAWRQVMTHPGYILDLRPTPPGVPPGFRFLAVNNRLGVLGFIGEILIDAEFGQTPSVTRQLDAFGLSSPPAGWGVASPYRWSAYIPLGTVAFPFFSNGSVIKALPGGGLEFRSEEGDVLRFDSFWNREGSSNFGRDLSGLRQEFMNELPQLTPELQTSDSGSLRRIGVEMESHFEPLLIEPAYRLMFDLSFAGALARSGDLDEARVILSHTAAETNHPEAEYSLARLDALAGSFQDATSRLRRLINNPDPRRHGTRAAYDGPHLLLRIGIEIQDPEVTATAVNRLSARGKKTVLIRVAQTLEARSRLWWDDLQPEDLGVTSLGYAPAGDAIACLAHWRLGRSRLSDITMMEAFIERNPDGAAEGHIAHAAALIAADRSSEALDELNLLIERIRFEAGANFALHQLLDLARAMRIVSLEANGQVDRALSEGAELLPTLTPNLLPAILVDKVLDGPGRG